MHLTTWHWPFVSWFFSFVTQAKHGTSVLFGDAPSIRRSLWWQQRSTHAHDMLWQRLHNDPVMKDHPCWLHSSWGAFPITSCTHEKHAQMHFVSRPWQSGTCELRGGKWRDPRTNTQNCVAKKFSWCSHATLSWCVAILCPIDSGDTFASGIAAWFEKPFETSACHHHLPPQQWQLQEGFFLAVSDCHSRGMSAAHFGHVALKGVALLFRNTCKNQAFCRECVRLQSHSWMKAANPLDDWSSGCDVRVVLKSAKSVFETISRSNLVIQHLKRKARHRFSIHEGDSLWKTIQLLAHQLRALEICEARDMLKESSELVDLLAKLPSARDSLESRGKREPYLEELKGFWS